MTRCPTCNPSAADAWRLGQQVLRADPSKIRLVKPATGGFPYFIPSKETKA